MKRWSFDHQSTSSEQDSPGQVLLHRKALVYSDKEAPDKCPSKVRLTNRPKDKCTYHRREALVLLARPQTSAEEGYS